MKFVFKNLGPITNAELELGDLTIIAGRNNTGKTYVAYTLYGFLKTWSSVLLHPPGAEKEMEELAKTVVEKGRARSPMNQEVIEKIRREVTPKVAQVFSKEALPEVFSSSSEDFEGAAVEVVIEDGVPELSSTTLEFITGDEFTLRYTGSDMFIERIKRGRKSLPIDLLPLALSRLYFLFLFPEFPEPFILSTERFGISLFYKELDFTKNRLVEVLQEAGKDEERASRFSPSVVIDRMTARYALPIKDNIDYTRNISELQKRQSELYDSKLFDDIRDMMGGSYRSSDDDIRFKSKARKRGFDIPLHIASSSARGLSDLYFFLRHVAKKDQLLIIDEPESHLDTANQIQFARLLARAVHAGLKVLITTHSDYIVKEINNLLMLSKDFKDKPKVLKKLKYSKHDFLKPDSVRAYVAENNSLTPCAIDRYGIEMPVFDTTIHEINKVSNELAFRLKHEGEE